jgi:uncharacterized protein (DUF58 family)
MDNRYNLLQIKTNRLVDSLFVWNYKTKFKARGIEFADFREYNQGDDVKNIDFLTSAKEWKTLIKLYEEERELSIYFLIDLDNTINTNFGTKTKKEIIEEIIYLLWLSALKGWDKIWTYIFSENNRELQIAKKWKSSLINIMNKFNSFLNNINEIPKDPKKWKLNFFNNLKINKSLVFLFTSNLDLDDRELKILALKNDLVVLNIFNSFENTLNSKWIKWLTNWINSFFIDIDNEGKKQEYISLRNEKINNFKRKIRKYSWEYAFFDENTNVYVELLKLMRGRLI